MNRNVLIAGAIASAAWVVAGLPVRAQQLASPDAVARRCMAQIRQQVQTALQSHLSEPPAQLAEAYSDAIEKTPSLAQCVAQNAPIAAGPEQPQGEFVLGSETRTAARQGGASAVGSATQQSTLASNDGQGPLADTVADANLDKLLANATFANMAPPAPAPSPSPKKLLIIGGVGGAVAVGAIAAKGGGSSDMTTPATPGSTSSGGLNCTSLNGTYTGKALLQTDALTCKGSGTEFNETATVSLSSSCSGTITLVDPGFNRAYPVSNVTSSGFSSSGTFPLSGASIPGTLSGSFSGTTLTVIEGTNYGGCINTYKSTLTKQ